MAGAFSRWIEHAEEAKDMRASSPEGGEISPTLRRRRGEFAEEASEIERVDVQPRVWRGKATLRIWVNGALARCFERWIEAFDAARVARKTMKWWAERALVSSWLRSSSQFFVKRAMGAAFNRWIEHHEEAKDMRAMLAQAAALDSAARRVVSLDRTRPSARSARRRRILSVSTRSAFNRWVEFAAEVSASRETLARAVARFRDSTLASAWSRWLERARRGESRRAKDVVARAHARLLDARRAAETIARWREATLRAMLARESARWREIGSE